HKGCIIRILYMINANEMTYKDSFLFSINLIFDASFANIFCTLSCGGALYITREIFNIYEIRTKLKEITICHFVPSQFSAIKEECNFSQFSKLKKLIFSGEPL